GNYAVDHVYHEPRAPVYVALVRLRDANNNLLDAGATSVVITDAPLTSVSTPAQSTLEHVSSQVVVGAFDDANPNPVSTDFSGTITWGDGASSPASFVHDSVHDTATSSRWLVVGTHTFSVDGQYSASATVHDDSSSDNPAATTVNV